MTEVTLAEPANVSAVAEYKRIFKEVLDSRPSGMRIRLAHAMGKNRSFVSQISNPAYPVPVPVQHLNTIFEVCHFSPQAKAAFLRAYARAHPRRARPLERNASRANHHAAPAGSRQQQAQRADRSVDAGIRAQTDRHLARRKMRAARKQRAPKGWKA